MFLNDAKIPVILVICHLLRVKGQTGNCHFDLIPDDATTYDIYGLPETTPANRTLWVSPTTSITSATVVATPHVKYVSGLRFSAHYDYIATPEFANFITEERSDIIQRAVQFTCANGGSRSILFNFHLVDENNHPPELDTSELRYRVSRAGAGGDVDILGSFLAKDADLWEENGSLSPRSSRPSVFPVNATLVDNGSTEWSWNISLGIDWREAVIGEWNFLIIVSDGRWSRSRSVVVDVVG